MDFPRYTSAFYTDSISPDSLAFATTEHEVLPEAFYTMTQLPVITYDNHLEFLEGLRHFCQTHPDLTFSLWSWFAGSGLLSAVMTELPFRKAVLFPVDLRYGWNIDDSEHQKALLRIDETLRPATTVVDPRCQYWTRTSKTKHEEECTRSRNDDMSMLKFVSAHCIHVAQQGRNVLASNPQSSQIFSHSPLLSLALSLIHI